MTVTAQGFGNLVRCGHWPSEDRRRRMTLCAVDYLRVTPPQNENVVINHLPPCRAKPVKALFVLGTQFKIFWMKTGRLVTSRHFITVRFNHWRQMDYFGDVFHTFLGLDSVNCLAVNGTVTSLPGFIQNILNCVLKTNKAFTGLERHGGKWLMTKFSFWGGVSL